MPTSGKTLSKLFHFNRQRIQEEYFKQANAVFQQWESDIEKTKEQEAKLTVGLLSIDTELLPLQLGFTSGYEVVMCETCSL